MIFTSRKNNVRKQNYPLFRFSLNKRAILPHDESENIDLTLEPDTFYHHLALQISEKDPEIYALGGNFIYKINVKTGICTRVAKGSDEFQF